MNGRALVTGGNGFVAQWAIRALLDRGLDVYASGRGHALSREFLTAEERTRVKWRELDVTRNTEMDDIVREVQPAYVLHLAAVSHVPDAALNPGNAYDVNVIGTVRLLGALAALRNAGTADPAVLIIGSAEQYGRHDLNHMPLHEDLPMRPLTLYAASKVAQEVAALQRFRSDGMRVICTRSFNHSGVGHAQHFLLPGMVTRALALPASGGVLRIGNGDIVRDFLHVCDVVAAYLALFERGRSGEVYNVCSGTGLTVRSLAEAVLKRTGKDAQIVTDAQRVRAIDVPVLIGSSEKLRRATGWTPARSRDDIIDDLIHAATN